MEVEEAESEMGVEEDTPMNMPPWKHSYYVPSQEPRMPGQCLQPQTEICAPAGQSDLCFYQTSNHTDMTHTLRLHRTMTLRCGSAYYQSAVSGQPEISITQPPADSRARLQLPGIRKGMCFA